MENQARKVCPYCRKSFEYAYISRHMGSCEQKDRPNNETVDSLNLSFLENEDDHGNNSEEYFTSHEDNNDYDSDSSSNQTTRDYILEDLIDDFELDEIMNEFDVEVTDIPINAPQVRHLLNIIQWLCLFLALWQYVFSITDTALGHLIKFLKAIFDAIAQHSDQLAPFVGLMPPSLYMFFKHVGANTLKFEKYVVCTACFKLYKLENSVENIRGVSESKRCSNILYPNHTQRQRRRPCGQLLMMKYVSASGKTMLHPIKTYCYLPIKYSLELLVKQAGFVEKCEAWRDIDIHDRIYSDIYQGRIWKEFNDPEKHNFFTEKHNYGLMINLDWFCPFKHIKSYSVGVIYAVITNLPRAERFKRKNVILIGIIPSMKKEPKTNSFLEPLVEELLVAWNTGFCYNIPTSIDNPVVFKLAIILVGCDIPACRKLCGFLGHSAVLGCSRCKKKFPGAIGCRDYSGFDRTTWPRRTNDQHRGEMLQIRLCKTKTEKEAMESALGTRYTVLARLPYYDTIRMAVIDPMHNLFCGTAKLLIKIWKEKGYLTKENLKLIQGMVDSAKVPSDVGKLPNTIDNFNFDGFNADEYKNFFLLFAIYSLYDILPASDMDCLRKFVLACNYLCNRVLTEQDLMMCDNFLMQFCKKFEILYGKERITPNIHLHGHLVECIYDYGPIYSFWLFSFERYNGILGNIPSNKKNIETQFMTRFCRETEILCKPLPTGMTEPVLATFNAVTSVYADRGSLGEVSCLDIVPLLKLSSRFTNICDMDFSVSGWKGFQNLGVRSKYTLSDNEFRCLKHCYCILLPNMSEDSMFVPLSCWKSSSVRLYNEVYGSKDTRSSRSSYISSFWCGNNGIIQPSDEMYFVARPGRIIFFISHILYLNSIPHEFLFAFVEWFLPVNETMRSRFGKPVEVWRSDLFELIGPASFIPVQRIKSKFVALDFQIRGQNLMAVINRNRALNI